jgi:diguanylate cyclase (GGDEF)-like protein
VARDSDVVARIGGDEFAVLLVECDRKGAQSLVARLEIALEDENVSASIGMAASKATASFQETLAEADRKMYQAKTLRRAASQVPPELTA